MNNYPWTSAWIVGGSSGLGAEVARQLADAGIDTIVSARSEEALKELCNESEKLSYLTLDISDQNACKQIVNHLVNRLGHLPDMILLNAAIYTPMGADDFDAKAIAGMMTVNYLGIANMVEALLPHKNDGKQVTIAGVASPSGWRGLPGGIGYGPTKAALINLFEGLKPELDGTDFDLRLVNPGFIKTRLTDKNDFDMPQLMEPDYAASKLLKGLASNRFDTAFPNPFVFILKMMSKLPYWLYFKLARRMAG